MGGGLMPGDVGQLRQQRPLEGVGDRVLLLVEPHVVHREGRPAGEVLDEVDVVLR